MELEIFPIDVDYKVVDGKPIIRIFGIAGHGERKIVYDDAFKPYCYVEDDKKHIEELTTGMSFITGIVQKEKRLLNRKITVSQVFTALPEDVPKLKQLGLKIYDADIPFYKRYLLDKGIGTSYRIKIEIDGDRLKNILNVELGNPPLKAIAIDIETYSKRAFPDAKRDPILAISLANYGIKKCFTWLKAEGDGIECVQDEKELILKVAKFVSDGGFNTLIGYNSDVFDLPYIKERADILGIKPLFNGFEIKIRGDKRRVSEINGSVHIDILNFIRNIYAIYNLKTEVLSLKEVAFEVSGEKKGEFDWEKINEVFSDMRLASSLCTYCINDSYITFKLYEKMRDLLIELNKLVGQTISDVSRMTTGALVEHLIMRKAIARDEVIPNKPSQYEVEDRMKKINEGAFVFQPKPGLYSDVAVVDFRSLYPSIIVSRNICPSSISIDGGRVTFEHKPGELGLIPSTVDDIIRLRSDAKVKLNSDPLNQQLKARVTVLKLIANGFYGYLGYYNARWYCFECAGEITARGREYVHFVITRAEEKGANVIYADTDSAFIHKSGIKTFIGDFITGINNKLPYPMELDLQGIYSRALFVSSKAGGHGAKKKYALCGEYKNLTIKGFQAVRRDWAIIAKEIQKEILRMILVDGNETGAVEYAKDVIRKIRSGEVPLEKMVIFTRLHKDISSYKQTGRHVSAASKSGIEFSSGDTIRYVITKGRPGESVSSRSVLFEIAQKNKIKYDSDYYINQQIIPSIMPILVVLGYKEDELIDKTNTSLSSFFN